MFLAQAAPPDSSAYQTILVVLLGMVFMYFILWRPEQKRRAELQKQRDAMKVGDEVIALGIVGTVDKIEEEYVVLRMVDGSRIKFLKGAVSDIVNQTSKSST